MNAPTPATNSILETVAETRYRGLFDLGLARDDYDDEPASPPRESWTLSKGQQIGRYVLVRQMGEGGFGLVWLAEQKEPFQREVALKLIKPGMDSRQVIARFEAERRTLALMEHPNIAAVLDAGTTAEGRPFFVMELVRGVPITAFCDERRLNIRQRLDLFVHVCHGVQHAHQKAILHRDLKPSNILVEEVDCKPLPKIIDFGIAKALGAGARTAAGQMATFTGAGAVIGTPEYMSPEQADSDADVDACSDIYSLGAILYELLTGSPPIHSGTAARMPLDKLLRAIREVEPARPSVAIAHSAKSDTTRRIASKRDSEPRKLSQELRGDLDWIVLKALDKDRKRRYESAAAFAADVIRYLQHEPVIARPPTRLYLLNRLVRRNRVAFAAVGLVVVAMLGGTALALWGLLKANDEKNRAEIAEKLAEKETIKTRDVANFLGNIFQEISLRSDTHNVSGDDLTANTVHNLLDAANERRISELNADPQTDMQVARILARAYAELDDLDKAGQLYLKALDRLKEMNLGESSDAADMMFWTAWTRHREMEERGYSSVHAEDKELLHCLAIRRKNLAPENELRLQAEALYAGILRMNGKAAEANSILDEVMNGPNASKNQASPGYGWILREKALLLHEQTKPVEAFAMLELAGKILSKYSTSQNRRYQVGADICRIRRTFYLQDGEFDAALDAAVEELDLRQSWLGYEDPRTMTAIAAIYLRLEQPKEAEAKLRRAITVCQKRHWYRAQEEALRLLVQNAPTLYSPNAPERLQDITALAHVILYDADRVDHNVVGPTNKMRLDEAVDLLRVANTLTEPYSFEAADLFATRAGLAARRRDYPGAITELAKASRANPNNCEYGFESAVYSVAAGNEADYARYRTQLLKAQGIETLSFANFLSITRAALLRTGSSEEDLNLIRRGLGERLREGIKKQNPIDDDDLAALREGLSMDSGEADEFNDWTGLLMGMAEYRAGNYLDASNWLNFAQRSQNATIAVQKEIVSAMNEYRQNNPGAAALLAEAESAFEKRFVKYHDTDSDMRLHDFLSTKYLLEEAKALMGAR